MPAPARITSVEAIAAFRADLLVYLDAARNAVDEVSEEVGRTRAWLQDDRGRHWAQQVRRRTQELQERQQELFSARLGKRENLQAELVGVRRAQQALEEAESKVKAIKQWLRDYPVEIEPLARHADLLRHTLVTDMGKASVLLSQTLATLHAYAELKVPSAEVPPPAAASET
ncbi:MAG: hypothetical protein RL514_4190 [Verrucomicrobiota bacterium]|jgi:small-conductance mechanosensitive channel